MLSIAVRPSLEPGWLEGCLDGKVGLVPENYVEFIWWRDADANEKDKLSKYSREQYVLNQNAKPESSMECFPHTSAFWLTAYSERKLIKNMWSPSWPILVYLMCFMTSGDEEWQLRRREWSIIYLYYLNMLKQISKFMVSILCNKLIIIILCTVLRNRLLTHTYILLSSTLSANSGARHTLYSLVSITLRAYLRRWRRIKREWTRLIQTEGSTPLNLFHYWLGTHRILVKFHHINKF